MNDHHDHDHGEPHEHGEPPGQKRLSYEQLAELLMIEQNTSERLSTQIAQMNTAATRNGVLNDLKDRRIEQLQAELRELGGQILAEQSQAVVGTNGDSPEPKLSKQARKMNRHAT